MASSFDIIECIPEQATIELTDPGSIPVNLNPDTYQENNQEPPEYSSPDEYPDYLQYKNKYPDSSQNMMSGRS
jgi:hypothetical protein